MTNPVAEARTALERAEQVLNTARTAHAEALAQRDNAARAAVTGTPEASAALAEAAQILVTRSVELETAEIVRNMAREAADDAVLMDERQRRQSVRDEIGGKLDELDILAAQIDEAIVALVELTDRAKALGVDTQRTARRAFGGASVLHLGSGVAAVLANDVSSHCRNGAGLKLPANVMTARAAARAFRTALEDETRE